MQTILTRRLRAFALLSLFTGFCAPLLQAADGTLQGDEQRAYLDDLKRLYLVKDERQALLAHSNALLDTYALRAGYQVGQHQRQDLFYRLSVGAPGELIVREQSSAAQGTDVAVRNQRIALFGVDPFIRYECPAQGIRCVLLSPLDGSPMLSIQRDHKGAAELAKAFSFLVRNLQKG